MQKVLPIISKKFLIVLIGVMLVASMIMFISPGKIFGDTINVVSGGSIQAAIDSANPGDTILVGPGTYNGNLIVYKSGLKIQSTAGAASTIIDASKIDKSTYTNSWGKGINYSWAETNSPGLLRNGFDIWSNDITIDGFTINNANYPSNYNQGIGILLGSISTTYAGFIPWNIDQWGGLISPVDMPKPTGVTLRNNIIEGASDGIYLWASSGNTIEYNEIQNTKPLGGTGIQIYSGGANNIIRYNTIKKTVDAISICGEWPNVLLDVSNTQIVGNIVSDSTVGIKFYNIAGANVIAQNNDLQNNGIGIKFESAGSASVAIAQFNNLVGNTIGVQNVAASDIFNATNNWWGDNSGPSGNVNDPVTGKLANGIGDEVSDNVRFDPWSTKTTPSTGGGGTTTAGVSITVLGIMEGGSTTDFVTQRLYESILLREPDPDGLAGWVDALNNGEITGEDAVRGFMNSDELKPYIASLDDTGYLNFLYTRVFGREADLDGLNGWLADMAGGMTREEVLDYFLNCPEWYAICDAYGITP